MSEKVNQELIEIFNDYLLLRWWQFRKRKELLDVLMFATVVELFGGKEQDK